jgi:hypothetical protein
VLQERLARPIAPGLVLASSVASNGVAERAVDKGDRRLCSIPVAERAKGVSAIDAPRDHWCTGHWCAGH